MKLDTEEIGWTEMVICTFCGAVLAFTMVAAVGFMGLSMFSGTALSSLSNVLLG